MTRCGHGSRVHVAVHEAAHALAAIERCIPMVDVVVFPAPRHVKDDRYMAGRVELDESRRWRDTAALPLLEFCLAGVSAERAVLGHEVRGGWKGDLTMWRSTVGMVEACSVADYEHLLGVSVTDVVGRMRAWAIERSGSIEAIAARLLGGDSLSETTVRALVDC